MKHLKRRIILTTLLSIILLLVITAVMTLIGVLQLFRREIDNLNLKVDTLSERIELLQWEQLESSRWFMENVRNHLVFMESALKELGTEETYTGPRMFEDGMVLELRNQKVLYPEEMPQGFLELSFEQVTEETVTSNNEEGDMIPATLYPPDQPDGRDVYLGMTNINDRFVYVNWIDSDKFYEYLEIHDNVSELIRIAENIFGGAVLLLRETEEGYETDYTSSYITDTTDLANAGLTKNAIDGRSQFLLLEGQFYMCQYHENAFGQILVFARPLFPLLDQAFAQDLFARVIMALMIAALIVYLGMTQSYVKRKLLTDEQAAKYHPVRVRRKVLAAGILAVIVLAVATVFTHSLGSLRDITVAGQKTIQELLKNTEYTMSSSAEEAAREEVAWYLNNGRCMASLFSQYPELTVQNKLQEYCDILKAEYLVLFDSKGNEIASSNGYTGFTLNYWKPKSGQPDFGLLLHGITGLVDYNAMDPVDESKCVILGFSLSSREENENPGALLMVVSEEQIYRTLHDEGPNAQLKYLDTGNEFYFAADSKDGIIRFSSDVSMVNRHVSDYGLGENSLKDGYMNFLVMNGKRVYTVTVGENDSIYYYVVDTSVLFRDLLACVLAAAGCFALLYLLIARILMKKYTEEEFLYWCQIGDPLQDDMNDYFFDRDSAELIPVSLYKRLRRALKDSLPENFTKSLFTYILCIVVIVSYLFEAQSIGKTIQDTPSLLGFILYGDWMRGFNLFALSNIIILASGAFLLTTVIKQLLRLIPEFTGTKGATISKLISSFVQYIVVLIVIYYSLEHLGFNPGTILAGLGIVGVAISLGAKDLMTDIFAGITIVFEGEFRVGDIVSIDGFRGKVESIGVRTTRIINGVGTVKIINNQNISNIQNLSRLNSRFVLELKVPIEQSPDEIREIMQRELPRIGEGNDLIISGPNYIGMTDMDGITMTIAIITECKEADINGVKQYVLEKVRRIMEQNHILFRYNMFAESLDKNGLDPAGKAKTDPQKEQKETVRRKKKRNDLL